MLERVITLGAGVFVLVGIVLCISLIARLIISYFFTQQVFDNNSTMPLVPGFEPNNTKDSGENQPPTRSNKNSKPGNGSTQKNNTT